MEKKRELFFIGILLIFLIGFTSASYSTCPYGNCEVIAQVTGGSGTNITNYINNTYINNSFLSLEVNDSQMENATIINIKESWLTLFVTTLFNTLFGAKTTDDLTEGTTNLYDNKTFNQSLTDSLYRLNNNFTFDFINSTSDYIWNGTDRFSIGRDLNHTSVGSGDNESWNQSLANSLYATNTSTGQIANNSISQQVVGNESYTNTYNNTYHSFIGNVSINWTKQSSGICNLSISQQVVGNASYSQNGTANQTLWDILYPRNTTLAIQVLINSTISHGANLSISQQVATNNSLLRTDNSTYDAKPIEGNCTAGNYPQNITRNGVQCVPDIQGGSSGNYFNQQLNTTSSPTFANLTLNGNLTTQNITANNVSILGRLIIGITDLWSWMTGTTANITAVNNSAYQNSNPSNFWNWTSYTNCSAGQFAVNFTRTGYQCLTPVGGGTTFPNASTTTCSGTDKFSSYSNATGVFTCTTDQTGAGGSSAITNRTGWDMWNRNATAYNQSVLTLAMNANSNYTIKCNIEVASNGTTAGVHLNISYPLNRKNANIAINHPTTATAPAWVSCRNLTECIDASGTSIAYPSFLPVSIDGLIETSSAGNFEVTMKSEFAGGNATIFRGSYCSLTSVS